MKSKSSPDLRPRPMDAVVALFVVALAIAVAVAYYGSLGGDYLGVDYVITHSGAEVARGSLYDDREITVEGSYHLTITVEDNTVAVTHSDCPTQDCVRTGTIDRPGQSIVCLPEQVIVKLVGGAEDGPDLVIG